MTLIDRGLDLKYRTELETARCIYMLLNVEVGSILTILHNTSKGTVIIERPLVRVLNSGFVLVLGCDNLPEAYYIGDIDKVNEVNLDIYDYDS